MATLLDFIVGTAKRYGPGLRDAALAEAGDVLSRLDQNLRDPGKLRALVRGVVGGVVEGVRLCPHSKARGEQCDECVAAKLVGK